MPFRLMKPVDLALETSYPLIVSLHGAAGRGNDNLKNIQAPWISIMARDELRREHPCFVLAPQSDRGWSSADEKEPELTEESIKGYPEALQRFYKRRLAGDGPRRAGGDLTKVKDVNHALNMIAFNYKGDDPAKGWITRYADARCDKETNVWDWLFKQKRQ